MLTAKHPVCVTLIRPTAKRARVVFRCRTVRQAERFIATREATDPVGVPRGDYSIDATEAAHNAYQRRPLPLGA